MPISTLKRPLIKTGHHLHYPNSQVFPALNKRNFLGYFWQLEPPFRANPAVVAGKNY